MCISYQLKSPEVLAVLQYRATITLQRKLSAWAVGIDRYDFIHRLSAVEWCLNRFGFSAYNAGSMYMLISPDVRQRATLVARGPSIHALSFRWAILSAHLGMAILVEDVGPHPMPQCPQAQTSHLPVYPSLAPRSSWSSSGGATTLSRVRAEYRTLRPRLLLRCRF